MKLFLVTLVAITFAFIAIGIKIFLKKNGEFAGTCASQNPDLYKNGEPCSYCGKSQDEKCENEV
tara:strand:+ start:522 stop:713 length:192 start_codon:yes stop_codon:yes gene_type:complete